MSGPARMYVDYLIQEGYQPKTDVDGDVTFRYEGGHYYIDIDTSDPQFFRIVYPKFWRIESGDELARVMIAADVANRKTKAAKVYVLSDASNTSASIEMFFERPEQFRGVFRRAMGALQTSVKNFVDAMRS